MSRFTFREQLATGFAAIIATVTIAISTFGVAGTGLTLI